MRIAFWGNFGALNLGNECVLAATMSNMRARFPHAEMAVICRDPSDIVRRHRVDAAPISRHTSQPSKRYPKPLRLLRLAWLEATEWLRAFRYVGKLDALLVTGCGILSDKNEGNLGLPYELFKWSAVSKLRGVKLAYVSVGAEMISLSSSGRFLRWALGLADYRSYRDQNSAALLASCGVPTERDAVRPDLAFSLPVPESNSSLIPARASRVAIGVIDFHGLAEGDDAAPYQAYLERLRALIVWLHEHGHPVRVIVGDFRYDIRVHADLRRELELRRQLPGSDFYSDEPAESFEMLLEQMQQVDFVIASRYHNVLLALLMGKPAISLSYEAKHEALMAAFGMSAYCQSFDRMDVPQLTRQFKELEAGAAQMRPLILAQAERSRASLAEQYEILASLIGDKRRG